MAKSGTGHNHSESGSSGSGSEKGSTTYLGGSMNPLSERGLKQRQQEVMKVQDMMLDDIGDGVSRLHNQVDFVLHKCG